MAVNPKITSVAEVTRFHRAHRPNKVATVFENRQTTYEALDIFASQVANGLIALDVKPQARVGVLTANSDYFFELQFGTSKANTVLVPVNWRLAPPEIRFVLNDAAVEVLFIEEQFRAAIDKIRADIKTLRHIIILTDDKNEPTAYTTWRDAQSAVDPYLPIADSDVVFQMYTSGTTGTPKGVQISHGNMNAMRVIEDAVPDAWSKWTSGDVSVVSLPNFHISGNLWGLIWLHHGGSVVILAQANPRAMLEAIPKYGVTQLFAVPAIIMMMLQDETCRATDFSSLKNIYYGGSPISPAVLRQALPVFGCGFMQMYGMTETTGVIVHLPPQDHDLSREHLLKSCGRPYPGVEVKVTDPDGNELPLGTVGEICVRTPALMKGYWNLPDATRNTVRDGWYKTGDAGRLDEEGYVYLVDRIKDMIVSGGENVYPIEVENALLELPGIADAAVIGVPDPKWGEAVKAVVVLRDPNLTVETILAHLRERIAGFKMPKSVDFVTELPRNPSGKILKREIRKPYWENQERTIA